MKRFHNTQNIAWFVDLIQRGQIILDPPYQRKSVWTHKFRRFFIDSIMRDYPAPPIFLNQEIGADGSNKFFVIDGRQRLESILQFVGDQINLPDNFGSTELDGKYFEELSDEYKKKFWSYILSVEFYTNANEELIKESFDRLNRNVLRLSSQELRNAKFDGRFITLISELSDDPFWSDIGISKVSTSRRMKDIEFISELFLLTMQGVASTSKNMLDSYYAAYDEEVPKEPENRRRFEEVKDIILKLRLDINKTRFVYFSDFYSLWGALANFIGKKIEIDETRQNLIRFLNNLEEQNDQISTRYLDNIKSQPNNISKRTNRIDIICSLIVIK